MSFRRSFGRDLGRGSSIFDRRQPAKRCVRTALVVVSPLGLDLGSGVLQRQEPVRVQALVPQAAVERLHESVVGRLTRPAEVERDAVLIGPAVERLRDELRPIVHPDGSGRTADRRDPRHHLNHLLTLDALVDIDCQRIP